MTLTPGTNLLIAMVGSQPMGLSIANIVDVLHCPPVTHVPRAGHKCAGLANLRGQIITMVNVRACLSMKDDGTEPKMTVVIENDRELYGLLFDDIGNIVTADPENMVALPATLATRWEDLADGILRMPDNIAVILNTANIVAAARPEAI